MLMTRRVPNRSRRSWCVSRSSSFSCPDRSFPASCGEPFSRISGNRSRAGRPRGRGGGSREGGGDGAGGPRTSARDVRTLDPFHERRSGPDLRPRGPGRVESPVVRVAARRGPRRAALRPLWSWLAWEDAARFRLEAFLSDVFGLSGALRQYAPGVLGYAVWVVLFASASACWFALWASLNLLLRARPAMTSDVARLFKALPGRKSSPPDRPRRIRGPDRVRAGIAAARSSGSRFRVPTFAAPSS